MPFPDEVVLPLIQHTGKPARVLARLGDHVERGDKIGAADGFISAPVHASATGTVEEIDLAVHAHPTLSEAVAEAALDSLGRVLHM